MIARTLLAVAALFAIPGVQAASSVPGGVSAHNQTIASFSPMLRYLPSNSGPMEETWNISFTGTSWAQYQPNTLGQGDSRYTTSFVGASVSITFVGTGVVFNGDFGDAGGGIQLIIDSQTSLFQGIGQGHLAEATGLAYGSHNATIIVQAGTISLLGVTLTLGLPSPPNKGASIIDFAPKNSSGNFIINPAVGFYGDEWPPIPTIGGAGGSLQKVYPRIGCNEPTNEAHISLGKGNVFMVVEGSTAPGHGFYSIGVKPAAPNGANSYNYFGYNPWSTANATMFMSNLDPNVDYTLSVTVGEKGPTDAWVDLSTVTLYKGDAPPAKKSNVGAIVGGVVGGVVAVILIGGLLIWWFRKQNKNEVRSVGSGRFEVDETQETNTTPFVVSNQTSSSFNNAPWPRATGYAPGSFQEYGAGYNSGYVLSPSEASSSYGGPGPRSSSGLMSPPDASSASGSARYSKSQEAAGPRLQHVQEQDVGPVQLVTVPPSYDPAWGGEGGR